MAKRKPRKPQTTELQKELKKQIKQERDRLRKLEKRQKAKGLQVEIKPIESVRKQKGETSQAYTQRLKRTLKEAKAQTTESVKATAQPIPEPVEPEVPQPYWNALQQLEDFINYKFNPEIRADHHKKMWLDEAKQVDQVAEEGQAEVATNYFFRYDDEWSRYVMSYNLYLNEQSVSDCLDRIKYGYMEDVIDGIHRLIPIVRGTPLTLEESRLLTDISEQFYNPEYEDYNG